MKSKFKVAVHLTGAGAVIDGFKKVADQVTRTEKKVDDLTDEMKKGFTGATKSLGNTANGIQSIESGIIGATKKVVAFIAAFKGIKDVVKETLEFNKAIRELTTLNFGIENVKQLNTEIGRLKEVARELSITYGKDLKETAQSMYQSLSAGVDTRDIESFQKIVGKLAIGGATDFKNAADGLINIANAYKQVLGPDVLGNAEKLTRITDAMFTAMKYGKTTIGELSKTMGILVPISSTLGVSYEEALAAVSAMTLQGMKTNQSMTYLRQTLMALLRPTKRAMETMEKLGISYGAAAFHGTTLMEKMGKIKRLVEEGKVAYQDIFTNVRSLSGGTLVAGIAYEKMGEIMDDMNNKAGKTESAFGKMAGGIEFAVSQLRSEAKVMLTELGDAFTSVGAMFLEGVGLVVKAIRAFATSVKELLEPFSKAISKIREFISVFKESHKVLSKPYEMIIDDTQLREIIDRGHIDIRQVLSAEQMKSDQWFELLKNVMPREELNKATERWLGERKMMELALLPNLDVSKLRDLKGSGLLDFKQYITDFDFEKLAGQQLEGGGSALVEHVKKAIPKGMLAKALYDQLSGDEQKNLFDQFKTSSSIAITPDVYFDMKNAKITDLQYQKIRAQFDVDDKSIADFSTSLQNKIGRAIKDFNLKQVKENKLSFDDKSLVQFTANLKKTDPVLIGLTKKMQDMRQSIHEASISMKGSAFEEFREQANKNIEAWRREENVYTNFMLQKSLDTSNMTESVKKDYDKLINSITDSHNKEMNLLLKKRAAVDGIIKKYEEVRAGVSYIWDQVKEGFSKMWAVLGPSIVQMVKSLSGLVGSFLGLKDASIGGVAKGVGGVLSKAFIVLGFVLSNVIDIFNAVINIVSDVINTFVSLGKAILGESGFEYLIAIGGTFIGVLGAAGVAVWIFKGIFLSALLAMKSAFMSTINMMVANWKVMLVVGIIAGIILLINNFDKITAWFRENSDTIVAILQGLVGAIVVAFVVLTNTGIISITTMKGAIAGGLWHIRLVATRVLLGIKAAFMSTMRVIAANWHIMLIAAIIAGIILLIAHFDKISAWWREQTPVIKASIFMVATTIGILIMNLIATKIAAVSAAGGIGILKGAVTALGNGIKRLSAVNKMWALGFIAGVILLVANLDKISGWFRKQSPVIKAALLAIVAVLGTIGVILVVLKIKALALWLMATLNPVGLIITAIAGLIAILVLVITNFKNLKEIAKRFWDYLTTQISYAVQDVRGFAKAIVLPFTISYAVIEKIITAIYDVIVGVGKMVWGIISNFKAIVVGYFTYMVDTAKQLWSNFPLFISDVITDVLNILSKGLGWMVKQAVKVAKELTSLINILLPKSWEINQEGLDDAIEVLERDGLFGIQMTTGDKQELLHALEFPLMASIMDAAGLKDVRVGATNQLSNELGDIDEDYLKYSRGLGAYIRDEGGDLSLLSEGLGQTFDGVVGGITSVVGAIGRGNEIANNIVGRKVTKEEAEAKTLKGYVLGMDDKTETKEEKKGWGAPEIDTKIDAPAITSQLTETDGGMKDNQNKKMADSIGKATKKGVKDGIKEQKPPPVEIKLQQKIDSIRSYRTLQLDEAIRSYACVVPTEGP